MTPSPVLSTTSSATQSSATRFTDVVKENLQQTVQQATDRLPKALPEPLNDLNGALTSKASDLNGALASKAQTVLSDPIQQWLLAHPLWNWALQHPLFAAILALVGVILLFNALKLLLSPKTWIWLLGLPIRMMAKGLSPKSPPSLPADDSRDRLAAASPATSTTSAPLCPVQSNLSVEQILERLQVLQQEQMELHQQLKILLSQQAK